MKQNFNELFAKMKPDAQEWVKARSIELLKQMALDNPAVDVSTGLDNCVIRLNEVETNRHTPEKNVKLSVRAKHGCAEVAFASAEYAP